MLEELTKLQEPPAKVQAKMEKELSFGGDHYNIKSSFKFNLANLRF